MDPQEQGLAEIQAAFSGISIHNSPVMMADRPPNPTPPPFNPQQVPQAYVDFIYQYEMWKHISKQEDQLLLEYHLLTKTGLFNVGTPITEIHSFSLSPCSHSNATTSLRPAIVVNPQQSTPSSGSIGKLLSAKPEMYDGDKAKFIQWMRNITLYIAGFE
ncbi:hypothetical protein OG21DRAFT_1489315 [Imleria badia]|nr:hypothetical protein OG21DRAFT_1489315 [Imleria badia]